jgi:hypothetical protein
VPPGAQERARKSLIVDVEGLQQVPADTRHSEHGEQMLEKDLGI